MSILNESRDWYVHKEVYIRKGPFKGQFGTIIETRNDMVIVRVESNRTKQTLRREDLIIV